MKIENVLVMKWGLNKCNELVERQDVKFPKECPVTVNFDESKVVGKGSNFRCTEEGIVCDVELSEIVSDTIAPKITSETTKLEDLSAIKLNNVQLQNIMGRKRLQSNIRTFASNGKRWNCFCYNCKI